MLSFSCPYLCLCARHRALLQVVKLVFRAIALHRAKHSRQTHQWRISESSSSSYVASEGFFLAVVIVREPMAYGTGFE